MQETTDATSPVKGQPLDLSWIHPLGMIGLALGNFLRRIVTLGIYDFWGRTEVRRRIWSGVRLEGEPLVYHGTGWELFKGFLVVFAVVMLPIMLSGYAVVALFGASPAVTGVFQLVIFAIATLLFGVGAYRAQRYRLSRTTWRGIRGSVEGNSWSYGWTYFWTLLLIIPTLGWIIPWRATKLQRLITSDMRFGTKPFEFRGGAGGLYGPFALMWFGIPLAILLVNTIIGALVLLPGPEALEPVGEGGELPPHVQLMATVLPIMMLVVGYIAYVLIGAWYQARTFNFFARSTHFGAAHFEGNATGLGFAWLGFTNLLILALGAIIATGLISSALVAGLQVFVTDADQRTAALVSMAPVFLVIAVATFGLLLPVTQARTSRYVVEHLKLVGPVDVASIAQGASQDIRQGEGLAQAFDVDAF